MLVSIFKQPIRAVIHHFPEFPPIKCKTTQILAAKNNILSLKPICQLLKSNYLILKGKIAEKWQI